jgi:hypothetical protein
MVVNFRFKVKGLAKLANLQNQVKKMPDEMGEATYQVAKYQAQNMKLGLRQGNHIFGGNLINSIEARKVNKNQSIVEMNDEGLYLDRMKPHAVWLRKGSYVHEWAMVKGNTNVKKIAQRQGYIWVEPHPFIDKATFKTLNKLNSIFERRIRNALTV